MTERMLQRPSAPALRYWDGGGEGFPVVLIHGVGADGTSWDQIATARMTLCRLWSTCFDACAVPAAHVVGFSLGGMIAQGDCVAARASGARFPAGMTDE